MRSDFQWGRARALHRRVGDTTARRLMMENMEPEAIMSFRRRLLQVAEDNLRLSERAEIRRKLGEFYGGG